MRLSSRYYLLGWALLLLLTACAPTTQTPPLPTPQAPPDFPVEQYRAAARRGTPVFRVVSDESQIVARVYRAGPLQRFGHDHTVSAPQVRGYVQWPAAPQQATADLYAALALLNVDEPGARAQAKLDTQPSASDIAGTRQNMHKVLETERFPFVMLRLKNLSGDLPRVTLQAVMTLHGVTREFPLMVELDSADDRMTARGEFSLKQTDFGMTPYSLLGGALQVADRVDVSFRVVARRVTRIDD